MGTKERKEREREQKRALIINATIELVTQFGFENTTMDEIAKKTEFSKGTLYLYFADKSHLFVEIKALGLQVLHERFSALLLKDSKGKDLVLQMVTSFIDFLDENPVYAQSLFLPEICGVKHATLRRNGKEIVTILTHALQIGLQDGSITRKINPRTTAVQVGLYMYGILQLYINDADLQYKQILKENNTSIQQMVCQSVETLLVENDKNSTNITNE